MVVQSLTILLLSLLLQCASALVEFTAPQPGDSFDAANPISVKWQHTGNHTVVSERILYDLFLCAGGNGHDAYDRLQQLTKDAVLATATSLTVHVDPSKGENHPNAYFLQMVINPRQDPEVIHSPRFTLTSMTGTFQPTLSSSLQSLGSSVNPPPTPIGLRKRQAAAAGAAAGAAGPDVPYSEQTGPTRYAPSPKLPGSKITLKSAPPLYPTSSFDIAKSFLPTPTVETTISVEIPQSGIENTASPAPHVEDDMQRFLNRWKD